MRGNTHPGGQPGSKSNTLEDHVQGLCTMIAAIGALMSSGLIYGYTFDWATEFFTEYWDGETPGLIGGWLFVILSTVTVFQVFRLSLILAVTLLTTNVLLRFAI